MADAADYFIRPDGGSQTQCTGLSDLPYPGTGEDQPCAWDHPFRALPPQGVPRIQGGDSLFVMKGSYIMGYGAPGAEACSEDWPWDCRMTAVPSGEDILHPTRILGEGWDRGCESPPELWGTERSYVILDLTGSSNVLAACLEITDHTGCADSHSGGSACMRDVYPFGQWAQGGITAADSANVELQHINIHGLAVFGLLAGRLKDWTLEDVRIAGNGRVGWDGDIGENSSNTGSIIFRRCIIEWNGCVETYPGKEPSGCWAQSAGGYGDGLGTAATGGDWIFEDTAFLHNTSDGLDLLYHSIGGTITINRLRAEGNAGNQVKVTGAASITNSVLVGNCAFFEGKPFTHDVDACRALGNTLEVVFTGGKKVEIINSTFYGQGDGLVGGGAREGFSCLSTERLTARNSIFLGDEEYLSNERTFQPDVGRFPPISRHNAPVHLS